MCGARQALQKECFRGTGRECRMYCMRLNNQRMENDTGFNDIMPQDLMNESYRSDFDSSLLSNRSIESADVSLRSNSTLGTPKNETSTGSICMDDSFGLGLCPSSELSVDGKRKLSVTPVKEDRECKKPRPFTHIQQTDNTQQQIPNKFSQKSLAFHLLDRSIRAEFKYQHLMNTNRHHNNWSSGDQSNLNEITDENSTNMMELCDKEQDLTSNGLQQMTFKTSSNTFGTNESPSIWRAFLNTETME